MAQGIGLRARPGQLLRQGLSRDRTVFGDVCTKPDRSYAVVGIAQNIGRLVALNGIDRRQLADVPHNIQVSRGQHANQLHEPVVAGAEQHFLQAEVVLHIPGDERRMVDHHEILGLGVSFILQQLGPVDAEDLDRHPPAIRHDGPIDI